MLMNLTSGTDLTAISLLLILSFFLGYAMDLIMKHHGFGVWGNMIIINVQFVLGFILSKKIFTHAMSLNEHLLAALAFAFISIITLSVVKAAASRA